MRPNSTPTIAETIRQLRAQVMWWKARQQTTRAAFDGGPDEHRSALAIEEAVLNEYRAAGCNMLDATYCATCQRHCGHVDWGEARAAGWQTVTGDGPDDQTITCSDACRRETDQPEVAER